MKQIIQIIFIVGVVNFSLPAQVPAIAPDFTVEDINGDTHNLYEILGSGKTVILDFYTTWCPPCWNYHNGKELSKMWELHGPGGFDDYVIIGIECDVFTDLDDIMGTGDNTLGDWTDEVFYPMVDNDQIQDLYNVEGYPTYVQICTDRTAMEMPRDFENPNSPEVEDYQTERLGCPVPESANDITAFAYNSYDQDICGEITFTPSVDMRNSGSEVLTSCKGQLYVDNVLEQEVDWNGALNSYAHTSIIFDEISISEETKLEIKLSNPNGAADSDLSDNSITTRLDDAKISFSNELLLDIRTDGRGSETYWAILNDNEEVVAEGGNILVGLNNTGNINSFPPDHPSAYGDNQSILETINLVENGCYTLVVTDFSANGICCTWGVGRYVLKDGEDKVLAVGGSFQNEVRHNFRYEGGTSSLSSELLDSNFTIWPNPVNDMINIDVETIEPVDIEVQLTDIYGNMLQYSNELMVSGKHLISYDVSAYSDGIYFISIMSKNGIIGKKIIKN